MLRQGNVFTGVCDSVHRGEGVSVRETPWTETPLPVQRPPFPRTETPLWIDPPDRDPLPQTENPLPETDPPSPGQRPPSGQRPPPDRDPPRQRLPRQRPPAPLDRDPTRPPGQRHPPPPTRTVTSMPYASYWNAFLFFFQMSLPKPELRRHAIKGFKRNFVISAVFAGSAALAWYVLMARPNKKLYEEFFKWVNESYS